MPKFFKKNSLFLIVSMNALLWLGCRPGVDYSELALDPNDVIDYGALAKKGEIGPGPTSYALMRRGVEQSGPAQINQELVKISEALKEIKNLPFAATFNTAQKEELDKFLDKTEKMLAADIRPKVANASLSAPAAIELQVEIEKNIKTDGVLLDDLEALKGNIPADGLSKFESAAKMLKTSFERIYQLATIYSQTIAQKKANAVFFRLKKALEQMKELAHTNVIFDKPAEATDGKVVVLAALAKTEEASRLIGHMTSRDKIKNGLINVSAELRKALLGAGGLKALYLDKVNASYKSPAQGFFDDAKKAFDEAEVVINDYDEKPKSTSDLSLQTLNQDAFSGKISAVIDSMSLSEETELARFIRVLSISKTIGFRADEASEAFIHALAVAIVNNVAEGFGLHADNIYGLNYVKLNETKATFGMSDTAYKDYLKGIAQKAYESTSNKDQRSNIYVLFADRFAGANMDDLVAAFSQGKGRVIIVANRPVDYKANVSFQSLGLDLASAAEVASALVHSFDPKLQAPNLAESLVKLMYGFRKSPEQVNLVSVEMAVKDVLARLNGAKDPSDTDVVVAIKYALGASKEGYDAGLIAKSGILLDNLKTVEENVKTDQAYYFNEARGISDVSRDAEARKMAEIRKYEEARKESLRSDEARQARKQLVSNVKETRRLIAEASKNLSKDPALAAARAERVKLLKQIDALIKLYGRTAEKLYELSSDAREAFLSKNSDFKSFFEKIQTVVADRSYLTNLKDLNALQITLRNEAAKYMPPEIASMLNRYPAWHPHAYVGATLSAGVFKGGATNADVEAFYAALPANQFEPLPAGVTPLKTALIAEYGALVAAYGTEAAARAAWLAVAAPVPLKAVRFETGSVGATYLATQPEEVQKLIPIWNDLLGLTLSIQEGAMNDIYKRLSKVKKL